MYYIPFTPSPSVPDLPLYFYAEYSTPRPSRPCFDIEPISIPPWGGSLVYYIVCIALYIFKRLILLLLVYSFVVIEQSNFIDRQDGEASYLHIGYTWQAILVLERTCKY